MYNNNFICTYVFYDSSILKFNPISLIYTKIDDDDFDCSEMLYQNELLQAFNLTEFDDKIINNKVIELYNSIDLEFIDNKEFKEILIFLSEQHFTDDLLIGFMSLFSYHLFHISHLCINDFVVFKTFKEENLNYLKKSINCM